jgi:hypothetical protein
VAKRFASAQDWSLKLLWTAFKPFVTSCAAPRRSREKLRGELAGHGQHLSGFFDLVPLDVPLRLPNEDLAVLGQVAHPPFHLPLPEKVDLLPGLFLLPDLQELLAAEPYCLEFVERG